MILDGKTQDDIIKDKWGVVRAKRDSLLQETDYLMMSDYPINSTSKNSFESYRQELRDLPSKFTDPDSVVWPVKP